MFTPTIERVSADDRGEIYAVTLPDDQELLLIHSKKGSLRGGHSHDVDEIVVMLTGSMAYQKRDDEKGESLTWMGSGDFSFNRAGLVHMGEFQEEDSWLIEYKIGTKKGAWKNSDYAPWRRKALAHSAR